MNRKMRATLNNKRAKSLKQRRERYEAGESCPMAGVVVKTFESHCGECGEELVPASRDQVEASHATKH